MSEPTDRTAPSPSLHAASPTRRLIRDLLERSLAAAVERGDLPSPSEGDLPKVEINRPGNRQHGDFASNLSLKLARPLRRPPLAIAEALAAGLRHEIAAGGPACPIADVAVAPPGFLNLTLAPGHVERSLDEVRRLGTRFGLLEAERPERVNVEFVSANPTGPLHIGNARGAFFGDVLSRVLEAGGHSVTREYYVNDFGSQVRALGESVRAVRLGLPLPQDGYQGAYVADLAREVPDELWARTTESGAEAGEVLGRWASERQRAGIEASLARLGVRFDVWTTQTSLHRRGWVERAVERLRRAGHVYEQDGATWFRSTAFGDDKDRVIVRSNGQPTYFAADIGYVTEKFSRGFERLMYLWGENHHGAVARTRNAAEAMGFQRERVQMLLIAWVRFIRDGREISMSKRSGEFITLDELLEEIGPDAARWFFAARGHTTGIDFDIELAKRQSNENPVYYVQYAHARVRSILARAREAGLTPAPSLVGALAEDPVSLGLGKDLLRLPEVVEDAAAACETQVLTTYATELATTFHAFYRDRRVVDPNDGQTSGHRLALVEATRIVLANSLGLLGISAPESM